MAMQASYNGQNPGSGPPPGGYAPPHDGSQMSETDGLMDKSQERPALFHTMSLGILIFVPWIIFTSVLILWTFCIHDTPALVYSIVAVCGLISLTLMAVRGRRGPQYWFMLGVLCGVATGAGCGLGAANYDQNMDKYWQYDGQRDYSNVDPGESALTHLDAGTIQFASGAGLHVKTAAGHRAGSTYCVAPIVKDGAAPTESTLIQFMAAGVDCCDSRGSFLCDDAQNPNVHSGVVYLESDPRMSLFREAATQAASAWNYQISKDVLFVQWLEDPDSSQRHEWRKAWTFVVVASLVALAAFVFVGFFIHFGSGRPRRARSKI